MQGRILRITLLAGALLIGGMAQAQQVSVAKPVLPGGALAVRAFGSVMIFGPESVGLEASARLSRFGLDLALSYQDFGYHYRGLGAEGLARAYGIGGRNSLSLGIGPSVTASDGFGTVAFLQTEVAYQFRENGGPSLLIGFGPAMALNDSRRAECPDSGWFSCFLWKDKYHQGDLTVRLRLAVGFSL